MPGPQPSFDVSKALEMRLNHNLSYAKIGQLNNVSAQAIHHHIKPLLPTPEVDYYKRHRADILAKVQLKAINTYLTLDDEAHKSLIERRGLVDFGISYDKERLERGQSTANLAISCVIEAADSTDSGYADTDGKG